MHSKPLREAIDLALDTMAMRGPIKRRDVANYIVTTVPKDHWALADLRESEVSYIQSCVTERMNVTHSEEFIERYLGHLPDDIKGALEKIPRFICITAGGGRESEHVLAFRANRQQWKANIKLKRRVADAAFRTLDQSQGIFDLLVARDAETLEEYIVEGPAETKLRNLEPAQ